MEEDIIVNQKAGKSFFILEARKSIFLRLWLLLICAVFLFDIFTTPLIIVWPQYLVKLNKLFQFCNVSWLINIGVSCVTLGEEIEFRSNRQVVLAYLKSSFFIDLIATVPIMMASNNINLFLLRMLHVFDIKLAQAPIRELLQLVFPNSATLRINFKMFLTYVLNMVILTHFIACLWLWVGDQYFLGDKGDPWRIKTALFQTFNNYQLYIFAIYWVCTVISTTGYGDYSGGTIMEYIISIFIEFTGVIVFVILMYLVSKLVSTGFSFRAFLNDRLQSFDIWFTLIEKCNQPKHISPSLYYNMNKSIKISFFSDFNTIVEESNYFQRLSHKLQTKLINLMFRDFETNFDTFFINLERGFINNLIVNLYARAYQPGHEFIRPGQKIIEICFIIEGQIAICEATSLQEPFCILPKFSYFGDYEILYEEPAAYFLKAVGNEDFEIKKTEN